MSSKPKYLERDRIIEITLDAALITDQCYCDVFQTESTRLPGTTGRLSLEEIMQLHRLLSRDGRHNLFSIPDLGSR